MAGVLLNPESARRTAAVVVDAERTRPPLTPGPPRVRRGGDFRWLAKITASALQSGQQARWDYTVVEVDVDGAPITAGRSGTAINLRELLHTPEPPVDEAWRVWDIDVHGADYPDGFDFRPIPTGALVEIAERYRGTAAVLTFIAIGMHDGTCDGDDNWTGGTWGVTT